MNMLNMIKDFIGNGPNWQGKSLGDDFSEKVNLRRIGHKSCHSQVTKLWILSFTVFAMNCKGQFSQSVFKDPIFVGSDNRIVCTHWKLPSDTRILNFEKTDGNRTCTIFTRHSPWKMKGADKFCMISLWSFWRQTEDSFVSSENQMV